MTPVFENEIKNDIKSGIFAPVYILFGDDSYLKKHYADSIVKKIVAEDDFFNFQKFENTVDLQSLYDSVNQLPLMADKKCVLIDDYDFEHADKSEFDSVCNLLSDVGDSCVLILKFDAVEFDAKRNAKAKKLLSSAEKSKGKAVCLNHRSLGELKSMLIRGAKSRGCVLSNTVSSYIIECVGEDINTLQNELNKLCAFADGGEITKEFVDLVCYKTVESSVYDYVREIINCNITNALKILDGMFYDRVEPIIILSSVASSFVDIFRCFCASNKTNAEVISDFDYKNKSFLIDKAKQNLKKFDETKLNKCLNLLLKTDKQLKSFSFDEKTLLEELTVKLGIIIASGGDDID